MSTETAAITDRQVQLLIHRAGGTPVFAYSRAAIGEAVQRVRAASVPGADIYYSLKANPHVGVVSALSGLVDGFDVCSLRELETALNTGMPAEKVLFTGPAKARSEAIAALAAGVAVTVESAGQAQLFAEVATELELSGRAVIRLNAAYPGRSTGAIPTENQFGVSRDDVAQVVRILEASPMSLTGLHLFWGSQYFDTDIILAARTAAIEQARKLAVELELALEFVSIGGGIGMPWCDGDPEVDWDGLAAAGSAPFTPTDAFSPTVVCEYGRSIVGPAGSLLTTVLDTKVIDGRRYILVDAGINQLLIASRLIRGAGRGQPLVRVMGARDPEATSPAHVTGPLCSQLDVLAEDVLLPEVAVGDTLMFSRVGAYGPTFSPSGFLSREPAREIVF